MPLSTVRGESDTRAYTLSFQHYQRDGCLLSGYGLALAALFLISFFSLCSSYEPSSCISNLLPPDPSYPCLSVSIYASSLRALRVQRVRLRVRRPARPSLPHSTQDGMVESFAHWLPGLGASRQSRLAGLLSSTTRQTQSCELDAFFCLLQVLLS